MRLQSVSTRRLTYISVKIKFTIGTLCNVAPDPVVEGMSAEEYEVIKRAIPFISYEWHSLADRESKVLNQVTPIVKK